MTGDKVLLVRVETRGADVVPIATLPNTSPGGEAGVRENCPGGGGGGVVVVTPNAVQVPACGPAEVQVIVYGEVEPNAKFRNIPCPEESIHCCKIGREVKVVARVTV
jgi:hypothetical protein